VLPAVGNDVVDLTDPGIARHHQNLRFVSRVCSADEQAQVVMARDLWTLFAAKEAAYKALVKLGGSPGFGHRAIRVAPALDHVSWEEWRLELAITGDADHVHAVAWTEGPRPLVRVVRTDQEEGEATRRIACELVAGAIGCAPEDLAIVREPAPGAWDGYGPPRIVRRGAPVEADVSLSHDGPFAAAAAVVCPASRLP
jgi:phosphopantetheinyl transferase (holo-ACP synthase)